jgi:hypothetical protein
MRGDGRQFPLEVAIAEFGSGEQRGFIVTARDISSQRRLRADLSRAQEQLERELVPLRVEIAGLKQQLAQRSLGLRSGERAEGCRRTLLRAPCVHGGWRVRRPDPQLSRGPNARGSAFATRTPTCRDCRYWATLHGCGVYWST